MIIDNSPTNQLKVSQSVDNLTPALVNSRTSKFVEMF